MIKLQAARCPQCNADIEVNKDLEKTICQYCGTTIMVSEAIQKVELSGTVKVAGIKNRDDYLTLARKHFEVGEYDDAKECLDHIINDDCFDIEAYCELIRMDLEMLKQNNFDIYMSPDNDKYNAKNNMLYDEVCTTYDRVLKIDKNNDREKYLGEYLNQIKEYEDSKRIIDEMTAKNQEIVHRLNEDHRKIEQSEVEFWDDYKKLISECFNAPQEASYAYIKRFDKLSSDGLLYVTYDGGRLETWPIVDEQNKNYKEEIDRRYQNYCSKIDGIISEMYRKQDEKNQEVEARYEEMRISSYNKYTKKINVGSILIGVVLLINFILSGIVLAKESNIKYLFVVLIIIVCGVLPLRYIIKSILANLKERKNYIKRD